MPVSNLHIGSIDMFVFAPCTKRRTDRLQALGEKVGRLAHGRSDKDTIAGAVLMPGDPADPLAFVVSFHVEIESGIAEGEDIVAHIDLTRMPAEKPPRRVTEAASKGFTSEWAGRELAAVFGKAAFCYARVAATMQFDNPPPLPPAWAGGRPTGAEYAFTGNAPAVRTFRWQREEGSEYNVWSTITFVGLAKEDTWATVRGELTKLINALGV